MPVFSYLPKVRGGSTTRRGSYYTGCFWKNGFLLNFECARPHGGWLTTREFLEGGKGTIGGKLKRVLAIVN
jgi:hypothetical protein